MTDKNREKESVPLEEAIAAVESAGRRLGLLHMCYAKAIIETLGEEEGTRIVSKAIKDFGVKIGAKTREEVKAAGLEPNEENFGKGKSYALPSFGGLHDELEQIEIDGKKVLRLTGCLIAKVWKEYGEEKIGKLYCYMDVAKYMGYNPDLKCIHLKAIPDHDDCCELLVEATTKEDRECFFF